MGVRGLTSFFKKNSHLRKEYHLHDTKVVFDGNNLVYWLYREYSEFEYGGDYDKFAEATMEYFQIFEECKITPIVIFDGGNDSLDWQFVRAQKRALDRLNACHEIALTGKTSHFILPILAWDVFKTVLNEIGIKHAQCDFGADDQITALANYYKCPVISQDSDFYIFNIENGYISTGLIDLNIKTDSQKSYKYLKCEIYYVDNFLINFTGINKDILPLFGTLMGNDVAQSTVFDNFFSKIQYSKKKKLGLSLRHNKMNGLLHWLKNHTVEDAVQHVLAALPKDKRDKAKNIIDESLKEYNKRDITLIRYLEDDMLFQEDCGNLLTINGKVLPCWFVKKFRSAQFEPVLINITGVRRIFLPAQIDNFNNISSYNCTLLLRKILYGIFLQFDNSKTIREYDRHESCLRKASIQALTTIPSYGTVPFLADIPKMDEEQRKKFFLTVVGVEEEHFQCFPEKWHFLLIVMFYWIKNSSPLISESFLNALLVTIIIYSVVKPSMKSTFVKSSSAVQRQNDLNIKELIGTITKSEADKSWKNVQKFMKKPVHNNAKTIQIDIVHSFSQLQTSCFFISLFCKLFNIYLPYDTFRWLNGTFIYNLTRDLVTRKDKELYIAEILGRNSIFEVLFKKVKDSVMIHISSDNILITEVKSEEKKKKKKKPKKSKVLDCTEVDENKIFDCCEKIELLDNRFKKLLSEVSDQV